jgi:hypothetical protein
MIREKKTLSDFDSYKYIIQAEKIKKRVTIAFFSFFFLLFNRVVSLSIIFKIIPLYATINDFRGILILIIIIIIVSFLCSSSNKKHQ